MINERLLRFRELRVVNTDGSPLGVIPSREALTTAREQGLDLVLVAATATPPVAKIVDFGKFKYENEKREKENKKHKQELKGIKITPRIAEHDLSHLVKNALKFLDEGDKVRVVCMFRQRELAHPQIGLGKLNRFVEMCGEDAVVERPPSLEGRQMAMILMPKPPGKGTKKDGKEDKRENPDEQDGGKAVQDHGVGEDNTPKSEQLPPVPSEE